MSFAVHQRLNYLWLIGFFTFLILSTNLSALEYELSDDGLDDVEWEGGRTEYEFADINNDGYVDILTIGDHGSPRINTNQHGVMVFFGDGTGSWDVVMSGDFGYGGIAVGDVNNDGDWDVGYADHHPYTNADFGNQMIEVALGDGSGENWEPWDDGLAVPRGDDDWYGMFGTDFGDFDNDGFLDVGSNSFGSGTGLHVYRNCGNGEWEDALYHFWRNNSSMDFVFGDMNNDGNLDFACALEDKEVHWGDGEGGFEYALHNLPNPGEFEHYYSVDLGDADGDGADDLAFVHGDQELKVFSFDPEADRWDNISNGLPRDQGAWRVDLCDMDVDGNPDMVFSDSDGIEVWLQDPGGDPRWSREWTMEFEDYSGIQAIRAGGDIDHNGFPDIVLLVRLTTGFMQTQNFMHVLRETSDAEELSIAPVEPGGGEVYVAGSARFIDWLAAIPEDLREEEISVTLSFSFQGPDGDWEVIAEDFPNGGRYQWEVANVASENCYIKYELTAGDETVEAVTPNAFTITGGEPRPVLRVSQNRFRFMALEDEVDEEELIISNAGNEELTVEPLELAVGEVFSLEGGDEAFALEQDEEMTITIVFSPPEESEWTDTLNVTSDGGNANVILLGQFGDPNEPLLDVLTDMIDFGEVPIDGRGEQTFTIHNAGGGDLTVQPLQFAIGNNFSSGADEEFIVEAEQSVEIPVFFIPSERGEQSDTLYIESDGGNAEVLLTGRTPRRAFIVASEDTINFGETPVGTMQRLDLVLYNQGERQTVINIDPSSRPPFYWNRLRDGEIAPDDSIVHRIVFDPTEEGDFETDLMVQIPEGDLEIPVYGTGYIPDSVTEIDTQPMEFGIVGITPNPFNMQTKISYSVKESGEIKVSLFDFNGRLIEILDSGMKSPGVYFIDLNADGLSTGTYWLLVRQNELRDLKKVIYLR